MNFKITQLHVVFGLSLCLGVGLCIGGIFMPPLLVPGAVFLAGALAFYQSSWSNANEPHAPVIEMTPIDVAPPQADVRGVGGDVEQFMLFSYRHEIGGNNSAPQQKHDNVTLRLI